MNISASGNSSQNTQKYSGQSKIIACATIIEEALPLIPKDMAYHAMDAHLHNHPDKLRKELQAVINEDTSAFDTIIIGYGRCSKAVIGISAPRSRLVIPRIDDCIAMFLGSQSRYRKLLTDNIGTYYLSPGWIRAGATLIEELDRVEKKYGKANAEMVKYEMLKNYTRLAFIDMGYQDQEHYYEFARKTAEKLNLKYEPIKGTTTLIARLLKGPWNSDFIVSPPGRKITHKDFD